MKNINKPKKRIKKTNTKDKNGFTLVELLAVIVVLAMLVLIAGRAVTGQITKAKRNTFRTETIEFAKGMIDYYDLAVVQESVKIHNPTNFMYACKTLAELKAEGYIEFSSTAGYSGYIQVIQPPTGDDGTVYDKMVTINITNGKYSYIRVANAFITLDEISADKKFEKQAINSTGGAISASCPEDINSLYIQVYLQKYGDEYLQDD